MDQERFDREMMEMLDKPYHVRSDWDMVMLQVWSQTMKRRNAGLECGLWDAKAAVMDGAKCGLANVQYFGMGNVIRNMKGERAVALKEWTFDELAELPRLLEWDDETEQHREVPRIMRMCSRQRVTGCFSWGQVDGRDMMTGGAFQDIEQPPFGTNWEATTRETDEEPSRVYVDMWHGVYAGLVVEYHAPCPYRTDTPASLIFPNIKGGRLIVDFSFSGDWQPRGEAWWGDAVEVHVHNPRAGMMRRITDTVPPWNLSMLERTQINAAKSLARVLEIVRDMALEDFNF